MVIKGAETEQKNENGMKTSYKLNVTMVKVIGDWIVQRCNYEWFFCLVVLTLVYLVNFSNLVSYITQMTC